MTTGADFQALFQQGKRIDRPALVILWRPSAEPTRVGIAVSRQVGTAVRRNRVRRRLREAWRAARAAAPAQADIVIVGRPAALAAPFEALVGDLRGALAAMPRGQASA